MAEVKRIFVEKREGFDVEAKGLFADLRDNLGISGITSLRLVCRYDVAGLSDEDFERAKITIFSEPNVDMVYDEELPVAENEYAFAVEYLPGQYDQRADSAAQCIQLLTCGERPEVASARVYVLGGNLSDAAVKRVKDYMINPVESREAAMQKPESLKQNYPVAKDVAVVRGFNRWTEEALREYW